MASTSEMLAALNSRPATWTLTDADTGAVVETRTCDNRAAAMALPVPEGCVASVSVYMLDLIGG